MFCTREWVHAVEMAIAPLVVAGQQDKRVPDARELAFARLEPGVAAALGRGARADVAHVHDEGELVRVDVPDQAVELPGLGVRIGSVTQQAEGKAARRLRRQRRAARQQEK